MPSSFTRSVCLGQLGLCLALGTHSQEARPPIRAFDIATIEQLGRQMFAQDQLAWRATDVLFREHSEAEIAGEGGAGWVTSRIDGEDVVRFLRLVGAKPEALYDVTLPADGKARLSRPADPTLSEIEAAQFRARRLALSQVDVLCADNHNTIALEDPESENWLIWVMSATVDSGILPVGGHVRFTVNPDGNEILARDALSLSCMNIQRGSEGAEASNAAGSFVTHLVSLTPIETHVFLSLAESVPLHVGTLDGTTWRVDSGRISRVDMDSAEVDGYVARRFAGMYEECSVVVATDQEPPTFKIVMDDEIRVIDPTESEAGFDLGRELPLRPVSVVCSRLDLVPAPNDYKVVQAGLTLYIHDDGEGHDQRSGILERVSGQFRFRLVDGAPLTPELEDRIVVRLASFPTG